MPGKQPKLSQAEIAAEVQRYLEEYNQWITSYLVAALGDDDA